MQSIRDHRDDDKAQISKAHWRWLVVATVIFKMTEREAQALFDQKGLPNLKALREILTDQKDLEKIWSYWDARYPVVAVEDRVSGESEKAGVGNASGGNGGIVFGGGTASGGDGGTVHGHGDASGGDGGIVFGNGDASGGRGGDVR